MYGIESISPRKLLDLYSQEELWKAVFPDFSLEKYKKTNCPYRKDGSPSFSVFQSRSGEYLFNDFSTGMCGNILKLIQLMFNTDYIGSIQLLTERVGGDSITRTSNVSPVISERRMKSISIKRKEFGKVDMEYWLPYNISPNTLKTFDVSAAEHVWIDDKLVASYSDNEPVYAYRFKRHVYKILRPFSEIKWISNAGVSDIQGWSQLPATGDKVVITKALKDVMVLYEIGVPAVAPQSEGWLLPDKAIELLQLRFKEVVVWFDNDPPGIIGATKYSDKHGFRCIITPETKDLSDYSLKFGLHELDSLWKSENQ